MASSSQQSAVVVDKLHMKLSNGKQLQNGRISRIAKTKEERVNTIAAINVNRESSMSLLIPLTPKYVEKKDEEGDEEIDYDDIYDIDVEEKESFTLKIRKKHKEHAFWRPICPFSISSRFETRDVDGGKSKMMGFLYGFHANFAILTPKRISIEFELKHMKFGIDYPEFIGCRINGENVMKYRRIQSNISFRELLMHEFDDNEWKCALLFNKILFEILYPNLCNCLYSTKECEMESIELRNYLILPILEDVIDWNLVGDIVGYHTHECHESYRIKQLLIDLGLIESNSCNIKQKLRDLVFVQNGSYFVPFSGNIKRMMMIIAQYKEDITECDSILQLLTLRFDKVNDFIQNITFAGATTMKHIYSPRIDLIDIGRNGLCRAPFDSCFLYEIIKIPFILFQFERIFGILQFIESQERMQHILMRIPLFTLCSIMYRDNRHIDTGMRMGRAIATLIYSTSAALSVLTRQEKGDTLTSATQRIMNDSMSVFRGKLLSCHIFDYLSPLHLFNEWLPCRYNIKNHHHHYDNQNINKYISLLVYPQYKQVRVQLDMLFEIQLDIFSSIYTCNCMRNNVVDMDELFVFCRDIVSWMNVDNVLSHDDDATKVLNEATKLLNVSADCALPSLLLFNTGLNEMNVPLQSVLCDVIRDIDYAFLYPPIVMTMIDPFCEFNVLKTNPNQLTFELLYDLGNIVLNAIITLSAAAAAQYKNKYLQQYLSDNCKYHRLYKHIVTNQKEKHKQKHKDNELMTAFMFAIIGAIYLDSNLSAFHDDNALKLRNVMRFIQRYLPRIVNRQI